MSVKIRLGRLKELKGLAIITTEAELATFFKKLRQDYYSPQKLRSYGLRDEFKNWLQLDKQDSVRFFSVLDEEDNFAKNDNWGKYSLFRTLAIRTRDGKIHVMQKLVQDFSH